MERKRTQSEFEFALFLSKIASTRVDRKDSKIFEEVYSLSLGLNTALIFADL